MIRAMLAHAYDLGLIDRPVRFGRMFARSTATAKRISAGLRVAQNGSRLFTAIEIRKMLEYASTPLRAMILMGVNGGFGNADCGRLPLSAVHLKGGIIVFPRPKTGIERTMPLWPETVRALAKAIAARPQPTDKNARKLVGPRFQKALQGVGANPPGSTPAGGRLVGTHVDSPELAAVNPAFDGIPGDPQKVGDILDGEPRRKGSSGKIRRLRGSGRRMSPVDGQVFVLFLNQTTPVSSSRILSSSSGSGLAGYSRNRSFPIPECLRTLCWTLATSLAT